MIRLVILWKNKTLSIGALMSLLCRVLDEPTLSEEIREFKPAPCPSSPNCISTQSSDPDKFMKPLPYAGNSKVSRQMVLSIVEAMPRAKVVMAKENYIHAEFRSLIFRFVDDVEFLFDEGEKSFISARPRAQDIPTLGSIANACRRYQNAI